MGKVFLTIVILGTFLLPKDAILAQSIESDAILDAIQHHYGGKENNLKNINQSEEKIVNPDRMRDMIRSRLGNKDGLVKSLVNPLKAAAKTEEEHQKISAFEEHLDEHVEEWLKLQMEEIGSPVEFFNRLVKAYKGKNAVLRAALRPVFQKLPKGDDLETQFFTELNNVAEVPLLDDHELCGFCTTAMLVVKLAAIIMDWDSLHDILRLACWVVLPDILPGIERVDIVCPRVLEIQGQVFYPVWRGEYSPGFLPDILPLPETAFSLRPGPRAICESQNLCFPPPEADAEAQQDVKTKANPVVHKVVDLHDRARKPRQAVSYRIAQITDVHIDPYYEQGALTDCGLPVCCHMVHGAGTAGQWGDYQCNTPQSTITKMFEWLDQQNPDFILYSGDNAPHSQWEENVEHQLDCTRKIWETFNATMPNMRVYPTIGNHEMYPTNQFSMVHSEITRNMVSQMTDWWTPNAGFEQPQIDTMKKGGFYTMPIQGKTNLRLISYNTNLMYTFNWFNVENDLEETIFLPPPITVIPGERTAHHTFVEESLSAARVANEKVILMGHHPPGRMDYLTRESEWLTNLLLEYADIIVLHITGHTHRDEFRLIRDPDNGEAKHVIFTSTTMTPRGGRNPSIRIYDFDANNNMIDFTSYQLDIAKAVANPGQTPQIEKTYSAREEYGLTDMSPSSWQQLSYRFESDSVLFAKYMYNHYTRTAPAAICDEKCRGEQLCVQRHSTFQKVYSCQVALREPVPPPPPTTPPPTCPPPPPIHRCSCPAEGHNSGDTVKISVLALLCVSLAALFNLLK